MKTQIRSFLRDAFTRYYTSRQAKHVGKVRRQASFLRAVATASTKAAKGLVDISEGCMALAESQDDTADLMEAADYPEATADLVSSMLVGETSFAAEMHTRATVRAAIDGLSHADGAIN